MSSEPETKDEAFNAINRLCYAVSAYVNKDTKSNDYNMVMCANDLYHSLTGKRMPKELRDKLLN